LTQEDENGIIQEVRTNGWNKLGYFVLAELRRHNSALTDIYRQQAELILQITRLDADVRWQAKVSGAISGMVTTLVLGIILLAVRYVMLN